MFEFSFYTIVYILVVIFDLIPVFKSKKKLTSWFYAVFLGFSYTVLIMHSLGIKIPSPEKPIADLIVSVFKV